jgi:hypothetical protein
MRRDVVLPLLDGEVAAQAEIVAEHAWHERRVDPGDIRAAPQVVVRVDDRAAVGVHRLMA